MLDYFHNIRVKVIRSKKKSILKLDKRQDFELIKKSEYKTLENTGKQLRNALNLQMEDMKIQAQKHYIDDFLCEQQTVQNLLENIEKRENDLMQKNEILIKKKVKLEKLRLKKK